MTALIYISRKKSIHLIKNNLLLKTLTDQGVISLLCFESYQLLLEAKAHGLDGIIFEDLLTLEECLYIDKYSVNFGQTWFKKNDKDLTLYNDISLGGIFEWHIVRILMIPLLKRYLGINKIIIKNNVGIIFIESFLEDKNNIFKKLFGILGRQFEIPLKEIPDTYFSKKRSKIKELKINIRLFTKDFLKSIIQFIMAIVKLFRGKKFQRDGKTFLAVYHSSHWALYREYLKNNNFVNLLFYSTIPFPFKDKISFLKFIKLLLSGTGLIIPKLKMLNEHDTFLLYCIKRDVIQNLNELFWRTKFIKWNFEIIKIIEDYIGDLIINEFFQMVGSIKYLINKLKEENISLIIIPSDLTAETRLLIFCGRQLGIICANIQHGLPTSRNNPDGKFSDIFYIWDQTSYQIYVNNGVPKERLMIIGSLKLSEMSMLRDTLPNDRMIKGKKINILILTYSMDNFTSLMSNRDSPEYLFKIISVVNKFEGTEIIVKLHPDEELFDYIKILRFMKIKTQKLTLTKDNVLIDLFTWADIVVGANSTALIESFYVGKEAVSVNFTIRKHVYLPPFDHYNLITIVKTEEELQQFLYNYIFCGQRNNIQNHKNNEEIIFYEKDNVAKNILRDLNKRANSVKK